MKQYQNMELTKDQIIQELITLLNQNQQREAANNVYEMADLIDVVEKRLELVTEELVNVRKQLEKMEQEKRDKTLKATICKTVDNLERQCHRMKEQLLEIKADVKEKASEIVAEAKAKGKTALYKVAEFVGIKEKLQNIRHNIQQSITEVDRVITKIDALGTGIRGALQKAANVVRTFGDKPEKVYGEEKFSKTELIKNILRTKRKLLSGTLNCVDVAAGKVEKLFEDVHKYQNDKIGRNVGYATAEEIAELSPISGVEGQKFLFNSEAFEAQQQKVNDAMIEDVVIKDTLIEAAKSR